MAHHPNVEHLTKENRIIIAALRHRKINSVANAARLATLGTEFTHFYAYPTVNQCRDEGVLI